MIYLRILCSLVLLWAPCCTSTIADEVDLTKVAGDFPSNVASSLASGSGIVVGPKYVLTNRHVVEHSQNKFYEGFRVAFGPTYSSESSIAARLICVADNYDLALIELQSTQQSGAVFVDESIAALGTSVRAYGFPLGSQFGVALTVTGGQISRHPISDGQQLPSDLVDGVDVGRSIWHDAIIASGSSGGPLFSDEGVLEGLNFANLSESKHALAVPGAAITEFVRKAGVDHRLEIGTNLEKQKSVEEISKFVVYIESFGEVAKYAEAPKFSNQLGDLARAAKHLIHVELTQLDNRTLVQVSRGEFENLFTPKNGLSISSGSLIRIATVMTVIQILEEGMLCELGGVRCFILLPNGGELRAKLGEAVRDVPTDIVYFAGEATEYETVRGTKAFFIPLIRLSDVVSTDDVQQLAKQEQERRKAEQKAKQMASNERYAGQLRRVFSDSTGKFNVDAVCIRYKEGSVTLFNPMTFKEIVVEENVLSTADRAWIQENENAIRSLGQSAKMHFAPPK